MKAISHANKILDWHENLMEEDIPPEYMWGHDKALDDWFEEVKASKANPQAKDDRTVVPMMENELTKDRRRR